MEAKDNPDPLVGFTTFVAGRRFGLKREYDRGVNRDLSRQNHQGLMKRNLTGVLRQCYVDALDELRRLGLESEAQATKAECESLSAELLQPFEGMIDELMQYTLQKHRSSCALSNFPEEHNPEVGYIAEVLQLAEQDFALFRQELDKLLHPSTQ